LAARAAEEFTGRRRITFARVTAYLVEQIEMAGRGRFAAHANLTIRSNHTAP
jgi:hypothetical protein